MISDFAIWCHQWVVFYVLISEVLMAVNINNVIFSMWPRVVWYVDTRQQVPQKYQHPSPCWNTYHLIPQDSRSFCLSHHSSPFKPIHTLAPYFSNISFTINHPYKLNLLCQLFYSSFPITIIYALLISYNAYYMRWLSICNFFFFCYVCYISYDDTGKL